MNKVKFPLHTVGPEQEHTLRFNGEQNLKFVNILITEFTADERRAWGSTFAKAERAGHIAPLA